MYDYGYAELAAAIVKQAVDDWRYICQTGTDLSSDTKRHPLQYASTYASFGKLQAFFQSEWCDTLCGGVSTDRIMMRLHQERREAVRKNRARPKYYEHNGESHTLTEWSEITGIAAKTLGNRLRDCGWTIEKALTTPPQIRKGKTNGNY